MDLTHLTESATSAIRFPASEPQHGMTILTKNRIIPTYPKVKVVWE